MKWHPVRWFRTKIVGLSQLKDRPHAVARGVAAGTFFGFVPLFGLKTLLAMGTAKLCRGNIIAAAVAVTLHDVILPLAPVLLRWEYQLGYWLLSHPHHLPHAIEAHSPRIWLHWSSLTEIGLPLLLGSVIVAIPFTIGSYFLTLFLLERASRKESSSVA